MRMRLSTLAALFLSVASASAQQMPSPVGAAYNRSIGVNTIAQAESLSKKVVKKQYRFELHTSLDKPRDRTEEERQAIERAMRYIGCLRTDQERVAVFSKFNDSIAEPAQQIAWLNGWVDSVRGTVCAGSRNESRVTSIEVVRLEDLPWYEDRSKWKPSGPDFKGARYFSGNGWMSEIPKGSGKWVPDPDRLCALVQNSRKTSVNYDKGAFDEYFIEYAHLSAQQLEQLKVQIERNVCDVSKRDSLMREIELSPRLMMVNVGGAGGKSGNHIFNQTKRQGLAFVLDGFGRTLPFEEFLMDNCTNSGPALQEVHITVEVEEPCDCAPPVTAIAPPAPTPTPVPAPIVIPRERGGNWAPWIIGGGVIAAILACKPLELFPFCKNDGQLPKGGNKPGDTSPSPRFDRHVRTQGFAPGGDRPNGWMTVPAMRP